MIFECIANAWSPKVGDPYLLGWITTGCYLIATILSFLVLKRIPNHEPNARKLRIFWLGLTVLLVFLSLNKQLDLQTFMKAAAKCHAIIDGWYADRRDFQQIFVRSVAVLFLLVLVFIFSFMHEVLQKDRLAVIGIFFLLAFILIHASYFNYFGLESIDILFEAGLNRALELFGIFFIVLQALMRLKRRSD